jgi:hypothetical protein
MKVEIAGIFGTSFGFWSSGPWLIWECLAARQYICNVMEVDADNLFFGLVEHDAPAAADDDKDLLPEEEEGPAVADDQPADETAAASSPLSDCKKNSNSAQAAQAGFTFLFESTVSHSAKARFQQSQTAEPQVLPGDV